ncbi:hypothetical protein ACWD5B_37920 [Streptomyces tanashiensis]
MGQAQPISTQASSFAALLALTDKFGALPSGYITIHNTDHARVGLQLETTAEFEVWRAALQIASEDVELRSWNGSTWLQADGTFQGVTVHLTGFGIEVPAAEERAA